MAALRAVFFMDVFSILNSNLFLAIVSLLAGTVAIWIYFKQKRDFKKGIANIILLELRNAEESVNSVKNRGADNPPNARDNLLMPNNSWSKYSYLFTNDFDIDEWDSINNFVNNCSAYDLILSHLKDDLPYQLRQKERYIQNELVKLSKENATTPNLYKQSKDQFIELVQKEDYTFAPVYHGNQLSTYLLNLDTDIMISSVSIKLKRISGTSKRTKRFLFM